MSTLSQVTVYVVCVAVALLVGPLVTKAWVLILWRKIVPLFDCSSLTDERDPDDRKFVLQMSMSGVGLSLLLILHMVALRQNVPAALLCALAGGLVLPTIMTSVGIAIFLVYRLVAALIRRPWEAIDAWFPSTDAQGHADEK